MIYCDPPYEQSTRSSARYSVDMDRKGHEKFLSAVIASSSKILISGYDCELYNDLTDIYGHQWKKIQFEVNTTDTEYKPKTKIETIWKNY
jgi:DNA adenine methylase